MTGGSRTRQRPLPQLRHLGLRLPLHGHGPAERGVKLAVHLRVGLCSRGVCGYSEVPVRSRSVCGLWWVGGSWAGWSTPQDTASITHRARVLQSVNCGSLVVCV